MYYLDLTPQIKEIGKVMGGVFISEKLLVSGLGKGGKGYFCLDVTEPENNTEVNADSWVKWEYPQSNATAAEKDNMGYTFSEAYFVKSYAPGHEWVVVFGNGYASASGTAALYVLDARSGELLKMIDTGKIGNNGLSTPTPIDINGDLKVDYVYAGDLLGNVWKFDLTDADPANWNSAYLDAVSGDPEPLFTARGRTKNPDGSYVDPPNIYPQPITTKLNVIQHCDVSMNGYMVLFGTGKYLSTTDVENTQYQTIYGVWDYGQTTEEYLGGFNRGGSTQLSNQANTVTLLEQTIVHWNLESYGTWLRVLTDHEPTWATDALGNLTHNAGWYVDLPLEKERVIRNSFVRDGKLVIITSIPEDDPCAAGGDSIVHEMNACSGARMESAQFDANGDGVIDENDLVQVLNPDWVAGSGLPEYITVPPTGIKFDTMMYPPIILITPGGQTERKYFSTASGNISTLEEQSERRGMFYWRRVEQ
jgi:type IV pilus assembly protein PilY1